MPHIQTEPYHSFVERLMISLLKKQMLNPVASTHLAAHLWYLKDNTFWVTYILFKTGLA